LPLAFGVCKSNSKRKKPATGLRLHFLPTSSWLRVVVVVGNTLAVLAAVLAVIERLLELLAAMHLRNRL
jgi:hypothetical protein